MTTEEILSLMGYDGVLGFIYDPEENMFYDECGQRVLNILDVVTPNDIFLFRRNPKTNNIFPYREDPRILCEILIQGSQVEEKISLYYDEEDNVFLDGEGEVVFEIFDIISPNDLYLFKRNKRYTTINHRMIPEIKVELYWFVNEYEDFMDVGSDKERIERYEIFKQRNI